MNRFELEQEAKTKQLSLQKLTEQVPDLNTLNSRLKLHSRCLSDQPGKAFCGVQDANLVN